MASAISVEKCCLAVGEVVGHETILYCTGFNDICASLKYERMIDYSFQLLLILYSLRCRETISLRGPVFHRSHGHNLVRPGHQSEVNYGYVSKICR